MKRGAGTAIAALFLLLALTNAYAVVFWGTCNNKDGSQGEDGDFYIYNNTDQDVYFQYGGGFPHLSFLDQQKVAAHSMVAAIKIDVGSVDSGYLKLYFGSASGDVFFQIVVSSYGGGTPYPWSLWSLRPGDDGWATTGTTETGVNLFTCTDGADVCCLEQIASTDYIVIATSTCQWPKGEWLSGSGRNKLFLFINKNDGTQYEFSPPDSTSCLWGS